MTECLPDVPLYVCWRGDEWQGADHPGGPWRPIPASQSGLPWPTDGPAVPESREPASVAPETTGPRAACALVAAFDDQCENCGPFDDNWQELCIAAVLRHLAAVHGDAVRPELLERLAAELEAT